MGVISDTTTEDAPQEAPTEADRTPTEPASFDPFLHDYDTSEWKVDSEAVNTMLTGVIAVANLLK